MEKIKNQLEAVARNEAWELLMEECNQTYDKKLLRHYWKALCDFLELENDDALLRQGYGHINSLPDDMSRCKKCGKPYTERAFKPLTICEQCADALAAKF